MSHVNNGILLCCFNLRDTPDGDDHQPSLDDAETELDPKTPISTVDLGTPGSLDETPPLPDNQEGFESWERWVSKLNILIWRISTECVEHNHCPENQLITGDPEVKLRRLEKCRDFSVLEPRQLFGKDGHA